MSSQPKPTKVKLRLIAWKFEFKNHPWSFKHQTPHIKSRKKIKENVNQANPLLKNHQNSQGKKTEVYFYLILISDYGHKAGDEGSKAGSRGNQETWSGESMRNG